MIGKMETMIERANTFVLFSNLQILKSTRGELLKQIASIVLPADQRYAFAMTYFLYFQILKLSNQQ
jgi:hypothetical protein